MIDTIKNQIEQLNIDNNKKDLLLFLVDCCAKHTYIDIKNTFFENFHINFMTTLAKKRYVITLSISPALIHEINHEVIDNSLYIIIDKKIYKLIDCRYIIDLDTIKVDFDDIIQLN